MKVTTAITPKTLVTGLLALLLLLTSYNVTRVFALTSTGSPLSGNSDEKSFILNTPIASENDDVSSVHFSWTRPSSISADDNVIYSVSLKKHNDAEFSQIAITDNENYTLYFPGASLYEVYVVAIENETDSGIKSNTISFELVDNTPPTVPENVTVVKISETTSVVSFNASLDVFSSGSVSHYTLYRDDAILMTLEPIADMYHYVLTIEEPDTIAHRYSIDAVDFAGNHSEQQRAALEIEQ